MHDMLESDTHISAPVVHVLAAYILFNADANKYLRKCSRDSKTCDASVLLSAGNQVLGRHGVMYAQSEGFCARFYGLREWQPVKGERRSRGHATPD